MTDMEPEPETVVPVTTVETIIATNEDTDPEKLETEPKMCHGMFSLLSQSAQIPVVSSPTGMESRGSSPLSNGHTSGYASYGSPASDFDQYDKFDVKPFLEEPPPQLLHSGSVCSPPSYTDQTILCNDQTSGVYGYPRNGFLGDFDPVYPMSYDDNSGIMNADPLIYSKPFGALTSTNFFLSNCPQTAEGLSPKDSSPLSHNHSMQNTICKVCGDTASGNHFGVQSCEACKSFFRRSVRANARYACRGNRSCAIEKHTRNRCQYCRMQKCMSMGMRKEAVQEERTPAGAKLQRAGTPTPLGFPNLNFVPPAIPYFPSFDSPTSPIPRVLSQSSRMYGSLPNLKMEFERPNTSPLAGTPTGSMNLHTRSYTPPVLDPNTFVSGGQLSVSVLVNADMQSQGPPEEIKPSERNIKLEDLFEGIRSSLLKVIEWAKRIPAFVGLSLDDQVKLLKASWCEHCTLNLASRNGPKSDTILLGHGLSCSRSQVEDPEVRRVISRVFNELSYWLDYLNVDRVEMACLKGIILFNPDAKGLSPSSKKKVEIYQEQILQALENRTKTMYPVSPQRFSKLLLRLAPLKAISLEVMQHMEVQRALGNSKMDNLFGELLDFE